MKRLGITVVGTARELAIHTRAFSSRDLVLNLTTGELRKGPGLWPTLQPAKRAALVDLNVTRATTENITIATALVTGEEIDGTVLVAGDLVLVKDQTNAEENGIYVAGAVPARHEDFTEYDAHAGILVFVEEGGSISNTYWLCTSTTTGTIDVTDITFAKHGEQLQYQANALPAATPMVDTDKVVVQRADGTMATIVATALKTYATA